MPLLDTRLITKDHASGQKVIKQPRIARPMPFLREIPDGFRPILLKMRLLIL